MNCVRPLDVAPWPTISLDEIAQDAALLTRVDRKYVVTPSQLARVLDLVGDEIRILEIDGDRIFDYRSTYFDTADFAFHRAAAAGRAPRCKVRTRAYVTTGTTWLEVKLRDRSGHTSKHRVEHGPELQLDAAATSFLEGFAQVRSVAASIRPSITTTYERTTLVVGSCGASSRTEQRVTVDVDLTCRLPDGRPLAVLGEHVIVETKSQSARPGRFDRVLWQVGIRPVPISKYALGVASSWPALPANRWRRVLRRYVQPVVPV